MITQQKLTTKVYVQSQSLRLLEKLAIVLAGSGLLILSAKLMVPFWPVAATMQTLVVVTLGMALGPRLGLAATLTYLAEGMIGFPVFADSLSYPGFALLMKPSAGFLISFPIAAYVAGVLVQKGWTATLLKTVAIFAISFALIYGIGMAWLISLIGFKLAVSNMLLWIPGEFAKIGLGVTAAKLLNTKRA